MSHKRIVYFSLIFIGTALHSMNAQRSREERINEAKIRVQEEKTPSFEDALKNFNELSRQSRKKFSYKELKKEVQNTESEQRINK